MNDDTDTRKTGGEQPPASQGTDTPPAPEAAERPLAETDPAPTPAPAPEPETAEVVDLDKVRKDARGEGTAEAGLIAELCALAGMPERTAEMLARGLSSDAVRRELLTLKAGADAEVRSHALPGAGTGALHNLYDNPVVRAATVRAAAAKEV